MTSQALTLLPDASVGSPRLPAVPVPWDSWSGMVEFAKIASAAGSILPKHIQNWQSALLIMQKALELAIPPVEGLMGIFLIEGKVVVSSRLMAGLVIRAHGPAALEVIHTDDKKATVRYMRRGMEAPRELSWTIEQAQVAGLTTKDNWRKYPAAMLRARALSAVCSFAYADTIGGLLTPEEAELPSRVTVEGDVVVDAAALPTSPEQAPPPEDDSDLPAPARWIRGDPKSLQALADQLTAATGETMEIRRSYTRGEARTLKAVLVDALAGAEQDQTEPWTGGETPPE